MKSEITKSLALLSALCAAASLTPRTEAATLGSPRAAKIIFRQAYPLGSFDAPSTSGTVPAAGFGHKISRVFNPDGSLLSQGPSEGASKAATWPNWLESVEVGVSGPSNTAAVNPACARFSDTTEATDNHCNFGSGAVACGAPAGLYRVSDYDCLKGIAAADIKDGNGGPGDGVYIRARFNRAALGSTENILAVFEYVAATYNNPSSGTPTSPTACLQGGQFTPENCTELTWKTYLKHNVSEIVQPFQMLVPPTQNFVTGNTNGVNPTTRQFILPLAQDTSLSVFQISRVRSRLDTTAATVMTACAGSSMAPASPANSPLCSGMIFHSLTFYRM
jgi:hypothetical protein